DRFAVDDNFVALAYAPAGDLPTFELGADIAVLELLAQERGGQFGQLVEREHRRRQSVHVCTVCYDWVRSNDSQLARVAEIEVALDRGFVGAALKLIMRLDQKPPTRDDVLDVVDP